MAAFSTIVTEKDTINLHTRFFEAWPTEITRPDIMYFVGTK